MFKVHSTEISQPNIDIIYRDSVIADLVYKITGKVLSNDNPVSEVTRTSISGSTYNPDFKIVDNQELSYGNGSKSINFTDAIEYIHNLAKQNKAINSGIISSILNLRERTADLTGFTNFLPKVSDIKNREIKLALLSRAYMWKYIDSDIVYAVLFYLLTGRTQYVKRFREFKRINLEVEHTHLLIKDFINANKDTLAKYYRRNRSLLLYIKKQYSEDEDLRKVINRISKDSRNVNIPSKVKPKKFVEYFGWQKEKSTEELKRMLYASNKYHIRNGRVFVDKDRNTYPYPTLDILSELSTRDDVFTEEQLELQNKGWHLAIPSSGKRGLGIIPNGSYIDLKNGDTLGIRWFDYNTDNDLSITTHKDKWGWDGRYGYREPYEYSGDMTHTIYNNESDRSEATEYFIVKDIDTPALLDVSLFRSGVTSEVELLIGDELVPFTQPVTKSTLGYILDGKFYVWYQEYGNQFTNVTEVGKTPLDYIMKETRYYA